MVYLRAIGTGVAHSLHTGEVTGSNPVSPIFFLSSLSAGQSSVTLTKEHNMTRTFTIDIPDDLEQVLTAQAERLNKTLEEVVLQVLSQQFAILTEEHSEQIVESDPLIRLFGSLNTDVPDLAENHDSYIGEALYRELKGDE